VTSVCVGVRVNWAAQPSIRLAQPADDVPVFEGGDEFL
jgi:hypothetical protein